MDVKKDTPDLEQRVWRTTLFLFQRTVILYNAFLTDKSRPIAVPVH